MRNAAPRGDNVMWCVSDWLMPFLWEMLGNSQGMVLYMPMLCMSQVFSSPGWFVLPFCTKRNRVTAVGYWKRYLQRKNFPHGLVIVFVPR